MEVRPTPTKLWSRAARTDLAVWLMTGPVPIQMRLDGYGPCHLTRWIAESVGGQDVNHKDQG